MANNDDIIALNAILGLSGQLLSHNTQVRKIKSDAELRSDELLFKMKEAQLQNSLEIEKMGMDLALRKVDEYDKKLYKEEEWFSEVTGGQYVAPEIERTENGTNVAKEFHDQNLAKLNEHRTEAELMAKEKSQSYRTLKKETNDLRKVLKMANQMMSPSVGGKRDEYDMDDWNLSLKAAMAHFNIDETNRQWGNFGALNAPTLEKFRKLNEQMQLSDNAERYKRKQASISAATLLEREINKMAVQIAPNDQGENAIKYEEIVDKIETAIKAKKPVWGKNPSTDEHASQMLQFINSAFSGGPLGFESARKNNPWFDTFLKEEFTNRYLDYEFYQKNYDDISSGNFSVKTKRKKKKKNSGNAGKHTKTFRELYLEGE